MSIILHKSWTLELARRPETGMGYQVIELEPEPRRSQRFLVLNGSIALESAEQRLLIRERVEKTVETRSLDLLQGVYKGTSLRVLNAGELAGRRLVEKRAYTTGAGPAAETAPELSGRGERFLRFSAFAEDVRIRPDGSVTAGTYVTSYADGMKHVKTGMDAVRRYALPNPMPASYRFHLQPPQQIQVRRGTVQPANGQPGGGDEVIFDEGAPPRTCNDRDRLPDGA